MAHKRRDLPGYPSEPTPPRMPPAAAQPKPLPPKPVQLPKYRHPANRPKGEA